MIYLSGLVGLVLVLTAEARVGNSSGITFCGETKQCLLFDLICETNKYEARHYDSVKWVSTDEGSFFMEIAAMRAFRRLYDYITGANADGKKIEMTAPVILKIKKKRVFYEIGTFTMSFLLPAEHQAKPPKPNDNQVYIDVKPDVTMYVRHYGGWISSISDAREAGNLRSDLDSVGAEYKKDFHYAVGYNSPMSLFNRHNEVWFEADDDLACFSSEEMESSPIA